jgi:CRISPR system Cascade subunit CasA
VVVDKVLIGAGEVLELDQERHLQDAVFTTVTGEIRKPLWPSPTRALWQDAHALYGAVKDEQAGLYARMYSLRYKQRSMQKPYALWAVGLLTKQALPAGWTHGAYPYAPGMEAHLYHASKRGSDIAEYLATSLRKAAIVAAELAFPAMRPADEAGQVARLDVRENFWPSAEPPFYEMLDDVIGRGEYDIDPTSEPLDAYAEELHRNARTQMIQRLDALPPSDANHCARAKAIRLFDEDMSAERAPAELRRRTGRD